MINSSTSSPDKIEDREFRYDYFDSNKVFYGKKKNNLPAMGWNSWNAFGSNNTEELTKITADRLVELGLSELGYKYVVLDDGCYKAERIEGRLSNEEVKFPSGFKALGEYIHSKNLKFGMYNDIGTNLCAGAAVGTCGHESEDARSYIEWGVDFLKVDNCYYSWDNATFSESTNAKYVFAPAIRSIAISGDDGYTEKKCIDMGMEIVGNGAEIVEIDGNKYVKGIGTLDGTGPMHSPNKVRSSEIHVMFDIPKSGDYKLLIECIPGAEEGIGNWLQIGLSDKPGELILDEPVCNAEGIGRPFTVKCSLVGLESGNCTLRLMNHRRQENTLYSYAKLLEGLKENAPDKDIIYSLCEWGKTQPQNWGKKVADSWRILNDITFMVGNDGDPGRAAWENEYTASVTSQYNKAVVMDGFAGLDRGWNDPDMLVVGMNGLNLSQNRSHMTMWCMMNAPLMLGLDLRRVQKGDELYSIIANKDLIALNQDSLGIQAKRVAVYMIDSDKGYVSIANPNIEYITNNNRVDVCVKPLSDGNFAISFFNLSDKDLRDIPGMEISEIVRSLPILNDRKKVDNYDIIDLWSKKTVNVHGDIIKVKSLGAYENATFKIVRK